MRSCGNKILFLWQLNEKKTDGIIEENSAAHWMESCQSLRSLITTNLLFDEEYFDTFRLFFYRPELHTDRTDDMP